MPTRSFYAGNRFVRSPRGLLIGPEHRRTSELQAIIGERQLTAQIEQRLAPRPYAPIEIAVENALREYPTSVEFELNPLSYPSLHEAERLIKKLAKRPKKFRGGKAVAHHHDLPAAVEQDYVIFDARHLTTDEEVIEAAIDIRTSDIAYSAEMILLVNPVSDETLATLGREPLSVLETCQIAPESDSVDVVIARRLEEQNLEISSQVEMRLREALVKLGRRYYSAKGETSSGYEGHDSAIKYLNAAINRLILKLDELELVGVQFDQFNFGAINKVSDELADETNRMGFEMVEEAKEKYPELTLRSFQIRGDRQLHFFFGPKGQTLASVVSIVEEVGLQFDTDIPAFFPAEASQSEVKGVLRRPDLRSKGTRLQYVGTYPHLIGAIVAVTPEMIDSPYAGERIGNVMTVLDKAPARIDEANWELQNLANRCYGPPGWELSQLPTELLPEMDRCAGEYLRQIRSRSVVADVSTIHAASTKKSALD